MYINISNPARIDFDPITWDVFPAAYKLNQQHIITDEELSALEKLKGFAESSYDLPASVELRKLLAAKGYDGIIYSNSHEGDLSVIAFEPSQVYTVAENGYDLPIRNIRYSRPLTESVGEIATNAYITGATDTRTTGELMRARLREKKSALSSAALNTQMMFVNEQAGIEQAAVKMGVDRARIESEVQMVRNSYAQAHKY